jgi:serine/threonine protein kinase
MNQDGNSPISRGSLDRLEELLDAWEECIAQGEQPDASLLCQDCPELLPEFLQLLAQLRKTEWLDKQVANKPLPQNNLNAGDAIVPGYVLESVLGSGGFGQVWRASGPGGVQVALKCLWLGEQRTRLEWKALSQLKALRHPHLLGLFGYWISQGWLVVGSELASGSLADKYISVKDNQLNIHSTWKSELLAHLKDAAEGLDYLHYLETPLIHGDVKPANLLLVGGRCKVGDFGLIRRLAHGDIPQAEGLTLRYAAPESILGKTVPASDQFALAVTYCHLAGVEPFHGENIELAQAHMHSEPDLIGLNTKEAMVLKRAFDKQPEKRYPSCSAMVAELIKAQAATKTKSMRPRRVYQVFLGLALLGPSLVWAVLSTLPANKPKAGPAYSLTNPQTIPLPTPLEGSKLIALESLHSNQLMALGSSGRAFFYEPSQQSWQEAEAGTDVNRCYLRLDPSGKHVFAGQGKTPFDVEEWDTSTKKVKRTFTGNSGLVRCIDVSKEGSKLATGSYGGEITVYDLDSGQSIWSLRGNTFQFQTIRFTQNAEAVVYSAEDGRVFFSRIGNKHGTMLIPKSPNQYWGLERIPDTDRFVLGGTDGNVLVLELDMKKEKEVLLKLDQSITTMALHPATGLLLIGTGDILRTEGQTSWEKPDSYPVYVFDTKSGKVVSRSNGHTARIRSVTWSQDGKKAFSSDENGKVVEWEVR